MEFTKLWVFLLYSTITIGLLRDYRLVCLGCLMDQFCPLCYADCFLFLVLAQPTAEPTAEPTAQSRTNRKYSSKESATGSGYWDTDSYAVPHSCYSKDNLVLIVF